MGDSISTAEKPQVGACHDLLEAYTACMEKNADRKPEIYELEWCIEEKDAYKLCRMNVSSADTTPEKGIK